MGDKQEDPEKDADQVDNDELDDNTPPEEDGGDESKPKEMDLPTALAALEDAKRRIRDVNRESAGRRKEITTLKAQLDTFTKGGDATTQQLTTLTTQLKEANEKLQTFEMRERFLDVANKAKIPFANTVAGNDAFTFARAAISKLSEDATDEDLLDIVRDVVKIRPHLLNKPASKNINAEDKGKPDILSGIDLEAIGRDFGIPNTQRSSK